MLDQFREFSHTEIFNYLVLPILIFLARIIDVSIGTVRIVMVSKGQKYLAPILGFLKVLIWILAIGRIMQNMDNWICIVSYAAGFATGNYIGLMIEERLAVGIVKIQIITRKKAHDLIASLKAEGYGVTHHPAQGGNEEVSILYSIIKRTDIEMVVDKIRAYNPQAFYTIEDVKFANKGLLPTVNRKRTRKGK